MKKSISALLLIAVVMSCILFALVYATESSTATKTYSTILVDDVPKSFDAYNINGNNYFKLRDIAYVLNSTDKQFEIKWDNKNQRISIIMGQPYTAVGGEMISKNNSNAKDADPATSEIYLDGQKIVLTAYNIDGNNYFKLRDLGQKMNFGVLWYNSTQTLQIYSTRGYPEEIIKPWDYVKILGKGLDVDWSKTSGGREYYNEQTVMDFKKAGVSHVRIRIADKATNELLNGLDRQVNDCLKNGIIPIIAYQADEFKNEPNEQNIQEVVDWWSKVAERYKDYSSLLSFDLLIEATDALNKQPEKLNEIYERLVTEIRKTNPSRIIMISPRLRSDAQYLKELKLPTKHNGYLMAEWHFYAAGPSKTNERKLWTTGTNEEKKLINDKINEALSWQKQTGIPTWVGAWMPGNYNDGNDYSIEEQVVFAKYMATQLSQAGIPFAVNSDTKFYNRENSKWIEETKPVFNAIFGIFNVDLEKTQTLMTNQQGISAGFNTKATLSTIDQCSYLLKELNVLKDEGIKTNKIWLRLNGGTISQKTKPDDWTEEMIQQWAQIQKDFGCQYVFVVNYNDTPESQLIFYNRLTKGGIQFDAVELGNEQYLPKFSESDTQKYDEVTDRTSNMTSDKYIKMSNEYIIQFKSLELPFFVQFAPQKEDKTDYAAWNSSIAKAINSGNFKTQNIYGSIHLYERDGYGSLDEKQINTIRSLMTRPIHFAVTESGAICKDETLSYEQFIKQEQYLTERILSELKDGDLFFNQVLYTDYKEVSAEVIHSKYNGITPKGKAIMELLKKYWGY